MLHRIALTADDALLMIAAPKTPWQVSWEMLACM